MSADAKNKHLTDSPLVAAYLTSLESALAHSPDREEILSSVREHITDALGPGSQDPQAVRSVLAELGPVEQIANLSDASMAAGLESPSTSWGSVAATVAAFLGLVLVFILPFAAVPLAVGALVAGLVTLPRKPFRRRSTDWLAISVSTATLLIALLGALFILPQGEPEPADPGSPAPAVEIQPSQ